MDDVSFTVNATNVDVDPNGATMTVSLEGVDIKELISELQVSDVLGCLDKSDVMEYYKDDPDEG